MKNVALRLIVVLMPLLFIVASQQIEATNYSLELCKMRCHRSCIKFEIDCLDNTVLSVDKCAEFGDRCDAGCFINCDYLWK